MDSQTIFAELRNVLAELYPEEQDARVVVSDAGLDPRPITFRSRAQINWYTHLSEVSRQNRLNVLLQVVRVTYAKHPVFQVVYDHYRHWVGPGGHVESPPRGISVQRACQIVKKIGYFYGFRAQADRADYGQQCRLARPIHCGGR